MSNIIEKDFYLREQLNTKKCFENKNCYDNIKNDKLTGYMGHITQCDKRVETISSIFIEKDKIDTIDINNIIEDINTTSDIKDDIKKKVVDKLKYVNSLIENLKKYIDIYEKYKIKDYKNIYELAKKNKYVDIYKIYNFNDETINIINDYKNKYEPIKFDFFNKIKKSIYDYSLEEQPVNKTVDYKVSDKDKFNTLQEIIFNDFRILFNELKNINIGEGQSMFSKIKNFVKESNYRKNLQEIISTCEALFKQLTSSLYVRTVDGCGLKYIEKYKEIVDNEKLIKGYMENKNREKQEQKQEQK